LLHVVTILLIVTTDVSNNNLLCCCYEQSGPPLRNSMPSPTPLRGVRNPGDRLSGAHLQMCSYHGRCTHNDAYCRAQHPDSTSPSTATATGASHCYFCRMRVHPTDG
uniref:Secreted protein n=1 Tax=Romanomermis culicivorax TaxID=13658 RepID=A0A915IRX2_ROMCU